MEPNQHEFLERVKAEILVEAERLRTSIPLPRIDPTDAGTGAFTAPADDGIERTRLDYPIGELTGSDYVEFVERAFRSVLKRPSDEGGRELQLRLLVHGAAKAEVLGNLRWSPEGRRIGVRVHGLLPRYLMAKLGQVRGVGFVLQWMTALAALPLLLRHQRAADTQAAARHAQLLARIDERASGLRGELAATAARHDEAFAERDAARDLLATEFRTAHAERVRHVDAALARAQGSLDAAGERFAAMERRGDGLSAEIAELRQHVLAMNHWTTSLQRSLDEMEQVAQQARAESDALYASLVPPCSAGRAGTLAAAAAAFARDLGEDARVLDLGSADGAWLRAFAQCGGNASGIESNAALARRAGSENIALGNPLGLLGRCGDSSLDGLAVDGALLGADDIALLEFTRHAPRALKPRAPLLLRLDLPARSAARAPMQEQRARALLASTGFEAIETFGDDDTRCLLALRVTG